MNPLILNEAINTRKAQAKKRKPVKLKFEAFDGKTITIEAFEGDDYQALAEAADREYSNFQFRQSSGYSASPGDRFLPEGKQKGDQAPKPLEMGRPKTQPAQQPTQQQPAAKTFVQGLAEAAGKKLMDSGVIAPPPTGERQTEGKRPDREVYEFASLKLARDRKRYEDKYGKTPNADLVPFTFNVEGRKRTIKVPFWQVPELNAFAGRALPSQKELDQRRLAGAVEKGNAAVEAIKNAATDNPVVNAIGGLEADVYDAIIPGYKSVVGDKGVTGHVAGMLGGLLGVPAEVATEIAVLTNPGLTPEQANRATANMILQMGGADLLVEKAIKAGLSKASQNAIKAGSQITPPTAKPGTKAALPRNAPPMQTVKPAEMPGFTGVPAPRPASVLDPQPMRSVLDEVLGDAPAVDANQAKEPWEMTRDELERMPSEDLDRLAFGIASGDTADIPTSRIIKKHQADYDEAKRELESQPDKDKWATQVLEDAPPVEVRLRDGKYDLEDGYHRLVASEWLGVDLQAIVDIEDNPIDVIVAKYGQNTSAKAPARAVETTSRPSYMTAPDAAQSGYTDRAAATLRMAGIDADVDDLLSMAEDAYQTAKGGAKAKHTKAWSVVTKHLESLGMKTSWNGNEAITASSVGRDLASHIQDFGIRSRGGPQLVDWEGAKRAFPDAAPVLPYGDGIAIYGPDADIAAKVLGKTASTETVNGVDVRVLPITTAQMSELVADKGFSVSFNGNRVGTANAGKRTIAPELTSEEFTELVRIERDMERGKLTPEEAESLGLYDRFPMLADEFPRPARVETPQSAGAVVEPKLVWDDMVGREYNARYQVQDGGKPVGQVDIAVPDGENVVYVKMVEVLPERRRRGIATALYNRVAADFPGYEIKTLGDIATEEGQAFRAAWDKSNTRQIPVEPENAAAKAGSSNDRQINATPTSPTSARQADINADREALGKAGFSTDDVRKWSELEEKANPNAVPREGEGYKTGAWTDQETVNATAKLRELKAQIQELRASKADPETLVTLEDEFDNLTEAMYRSGTEQGRALASRRYTMDVDMSVDGLRARYKARAKKNGTPVDANRLQELEQIAADYKRLQEQIDSGELVRARKRSKGPAKTKEELAEELSKMWDEFTAVDADGPVPLASGFTTERVVMIGKMAVKAVELGVATIDELVEAVAKQFRDRGLDAPDRATILNAWRTEREAGRRSVSDEVKAARAQRAKLEAEINAELDAPKKAEANAKKAAEAAENRARRAAERQQQVEANQKARAEEKARARAQREAADAEAKALREEQERILRERAGWDKRNRDRQREMERLNTRIAELEQSIEAGTGEGPKPRKQTLQDPELARAQNRMETLRKRARAIYKDQQPKPTWQRVTDATTSGRLLNPVNRGLDFLSGVSNIVNRTFIDGNVAALTSALSKDARVGSLLDPAKIKRVVDLMKSSDLARQLLDEGMYGNRGLGGKLAGMTDIPAKMFLYHVALDDMAFNIARRQLGKAPKEQITRRALDLLQNPTDEMVETATAEMLAQTYNTQTFVGAHLASTKSAMYKAMRGNDPGPIRSVAAGFTTGMFDMLTKFSNVITNVAKDRGARTLNIGGIPVSSAYAVGEFATKKIAKKAMTTAERRHLQMLFAKGATGSAFTYLGYNYARELGIVPQISRNTNEEGKDPGNPYVDGGGVAGVLEQVGGFLTPFLWGAQLREIDEANLTDKQKSALKRQTLVEMAMSTPATGGMEKIVGLWQGRTSHWTFGGGVMASQMPGPVKLAGERLDAYNSSDPNDAFILRLFSKATERRTKVKDTDGMTESEAALWELLRPIMRNTPMLREKLPEQDKKNVNR